MRKEFLRYLLILFVFIFCGCAQLTEFGRVLWGSSVRSMEKVRDQASGRTFECSFDACFDAVLALSPEEDDLLESQHQKPFDVFSQDRIRSFIVVMGIKGNVDTTEVGVFFTEINDQRTKVDIASLSTSAKEKVEAAVFDELTLRFVEQTNN